MEDLQRKLKQAEKNRPVVVQRRRRGGCFDSETKVVRKNKEGDK